MGIYNHKAAMSEKVMTIHKRQHYFIVLPHRLIYKQNQDKKINILIATIVFLVMVIRVVEKNVHKSGGEKRRFALELVALLLSEAKVDEGLIGDALQVAEVGINTLCGVRSGEIDLGKAATGCCHILSKRIK